MAGLARSAIRRAAPRGGGGRNATGGRRAAGAMRGMSLVEVLVSVTLVALLTGALVFGSGMLFGARQRAAASLILASIRQGITRANTTGKPVRLVLDLDAGRVNLEEGTGGPMLREREQGASTGAGAEPATEAEREARAEADRILKGPRAPRPSFVPVAGYVAPGEDATLGRELGQGVGFVSFQSDHDGEPRTLGRAYLYFWPGGLTERAAIQIRREGAPDGITVMVHGLTGRARIVQGLQALPPAPTDDEASEREDSP